MPLLPETWVFKCVPWTSTSVSPVNLLEMQIPRHHPRLSESGTYGRGPAISVPTSVPTTWMHAKAQHWPRTSGNATQPCIQHPLEKSALEEGEAQTSWAGGQAAHRSPGKRNHPIQVALLRWQKHSRGRSAFFKKRRIERKLGFHLTLAAYF